MIKKTKKPNRKSYNKYNRFIKKYSDIVFRPGAAFTSYFGLTERYIYENGRQIWGFPGIHKGVDRGGSRLEYNNIKNGIFSPFDFYKSGCFNWDGKGYGFDIFLYHKTGFRVRICHCYPEDVNILPLLKKKENITMETFIGLIGSNGNSTAPHTHTEIEAWNLKKWVEDCQILEWLLYEKYGEKSLMTYNKDEIVEICKHIKKSKSWDPDPTIDFYNNMLKSKRVVFLNDYKMITQDSKKRLSTLYNSKALFNF